MLLKINLHLALVGLLGIIFLSAPAFADDSKHTFLQEDAVEELQLSNGMNFLLVPHGETPIFSAYIRFRVGALDEPAGLTGVAHVIEHMAFKGTRSWGTKNWQKEKPFLDDLETLGQSLSQGYERGADAREIALIREKMKALYAQHQQWIIEEEISLELQKRGGLNLNATTSQDLTSYFVSLPSAELAFWAKLESERLFKPVFRNFYQERDVVLEERRMRVEDSPMGSFFAALMRAAFAKSPYARPTIGERQDLLTLTRTKAEKFFQKHYSPERAIGVIVGRFDLAQTRSILEKTFGKIASQKDVVVADRPELDPPPYERPQCKLSLAKDGQTRVALAYHKPALPHRDDYLFDMMSTLLGEGKSSRLYHQLVVKQRLAASVDIYASTPGSRLSNLFVIMATPQPGVSSQELMKALQAELKAFKKIVITDSEWQRAKKQLINHRVWNFEKNDSLASELSYYAALGDWRYPINYSDVIGSITRTEVQTAAKKYLVSGNSCSAYLKGSS